MRPDNVLLKNAVDHFLKSQFGGLHFNMLQKRYFEQSWYSRRAHGDARPDKSGHISPWDDIVKRVAKKHQFDWRLIVAQIYQESRFDPRSKSWAGAIGPMQLMPRTARSLGVTDPTNPLQSIEAGVRYLRTLIDRFDPTLDLRTRIAFALASYNVGYAHVKDARRVARWLKNDPDLWFGHTDAAMLKLQDPDYYNHVQFGYARGSETVKYVKDIFARYKSYQNARPLSVSE